MSEQAEPDRSGSRFDRPIVYVLTVLSLLLVGGGAFAFLTWTAAKPEGDSKQKDGRLVRVFEAQKTSHQLAISAYGTSRAADVWTAIAEVRGRAVEVNPRFEPGEVLPAGTPLVRIDRTDYELARDRAEADAEAKQLQIKELNQTEGDLKEILKLQERQVELAEAECERQQRLHEKRATPLSALEAAEAACVTRRLTVQKTRDSLSLVSVQRLQLEAMLKVATTQLAQAVRDLDRCEIRLPAEFDARCASKSVEVSQFVTAGERLGRFLALDTAEVVALVEPHKAAALVAGTGQDSGRLDLMAISREESLWERFKIPARVRWTWGQQRIDWWGRLTRIGSSLDPGTRSIPLIIEVRNRYENGQGEAPPPLLPDVFCDVTVYGPTLEDVVVIPREALHQVAPESLRDRPATGFDGETFVDVVYVLEVAASEKEEGRGRRKENEAFHLKGTLQMREVTVAALEKDSVVISEGIETGDMVILTDLFPASEEMLLRGRWDDCPVAPRGKVDVPEGFFDEVKPARGLREGRSASGSNPAAGPNTEAPP